MTTEATPGALGSNAGLGVCHPERASACGLTECAGKPMCKRCVSWTVKPMDEGELWSWVRSVMSQGADIRFDYDHGTHKTYEHYSARLDAAAAERADELWARLKTPNAKLTGPSANQGTNDEHH